MSDELLTEGTQKAREIEQERISRLKNKKKCLDGVSQSFASQSEDGEPFVLDVDGKTGKPLIEVHSKIVKRLKPHQLEGVQFMWDSCYESVSRLEQNEGSGCVLAHCMGLGKTFQVCLLFRENLIIYLPMLIWTKMVICHQKLLNFILYLLTIVLLLL